MRLKEVILKNFRAYMGEVRIPIGSMTSLIGKNDIGKSSIIEAICISLGSCGLKVDRKAPQGLICLMEYQFCGGES